MTAYLNEYQKMMVEVRTELHTRPDLYDKLNGYIEGLEQQKNAAHTQYINTFNQLEKVDYELANTKQVSEHLGNTLKLSERENKAMRELLSIWV